MTGEKPMKNKISLISIFLIFIPVIGFAWNAQNTHQPLTRRSIELMSDDYKDIKKYADRIVSGTGNSNLLMAGKVEIDAHGNLWINGGNAKDIWEKRAWELYKAFNFSETYYSLGNIIHLTQDQTVPPHGANIYHSSLSDNFEIEASGITNVISIRGFLSENVWAPYDYYWSAINATWTGCENWRSIVNKEVDSTIIPSGTRFWVRNLTPIAVKEWGYYGGPNNSDFFDDITAGDLIRSRFDEAVTQVTGVLMSASKALPPLSSNLTVPTSVDGIFTIDFVKGSGINFMIQENRTSTVTVSLFVQETTQSIKTEGFFKSIDASESATGTKQFKSETGEVLWSSKTVMLFDTLSKELRILPKMAEIKLTWKGDVQGEALKSRVEPYTLVLKVEDADGC
jgi:hypothetical protein